MSLTYLAMEFTGIFEKNSFFSVWQKTFARGLLKRHLFKWLRKSRMITLNMSTMIYLPINQVFDFVSTPENDFQWQYGILATARLSSGISKMGTFFRSIGHLMGHRNLSTFEVTEYEVNRKYGFKSLSGPMHSQTSYTFAMANGGTRITISMRVHLVNFFKMNERIFGKKIRKQLKGDLTLLKDLLEEKIPSLKAYPVAG